MSHRPYPNPDRARHQLDRHDNETPPLADGSQQAPAFAMPRLVITDEVREAMGARLAEFGTAMQAAFRPRLASGEEKNA